MNAEAQAQEVPRVYVPYERNHAFRTDEWYRELCAKILEGGVHNEGMPLTDHAVNILTNHLYWMCGVPIVVISIHFERCVGRQKRK